MTAASDADLGAAERLQRIFAGFGATISHGPIWDFSQLHRGIPIFCEVSPRSADEVIAIVSLARRHQVALRTRGCGHALNGSSVPRQGELLVRTKALIEFGAHPNRTVSAGGGVVLWNFDEGLRTLGLALPVMNDGYAGPSVGGFIAAGGFGPGSRIAGGFWDNVAALTIVDGRGERLTLSREDPLFPWVFGSMGQLGIVVEAELDVIPCATPISLGERKGPAIATRVATYEQPLPSPETPDEAGRLFWFTAFVSEPDLGHARTQLDMLESDYPDTFAFRDRYTYFIAHRHLVAPLVWPHAVPCYAIGSWGILKDQPRQGASPVMEFEADFMKMVLSNGYRRYVQSELPCGTDLYETYFGSELYARFRMLKQVHDPDNLFNRGWVFT